jgi:hypothetical protein
MMEKKLMSAHFINPLTFSFDFLKRGEKPKHENAKKVSTFPHNLVVGESSICSKKQIVK